MDGYKSEHTYPRLEDQAYLRKNPIKEIGITTHTIDNATYDPETGILKLWVAGHKFVNGNSVQILGNSLVFTCDQDDHHTDHSYPRTTDPWSGRWLKILNSDPDSFEVNVGKSLSYRFSPTAGTYDPSTGDMVLDIGTHSLAQGQTIKIQPNSLVWTCGLDNNATEHTYPRAIIDTHQAASGSTYAPLTGVLDVTTTATHGLKVGDWIKFEEGAITFNCTMDGGSSNKAYPRKTDPTYDKWLQVETLPSTTRFTVNVGQSPIKNFTPTDADYNPTTGIMELTIGTHGLAVGDAIKLAQDSLTFTCDYNNNNHVTPKTYPRSNGNDSATYNTSIEDTAIGNAVLDVIEDEGLQEHAREHGEYFLNGLRKLKETYPAIGDVRGRGLFIGFELVRDRITLEPDAEEAGRVVREMRDQGVLLSTDGPHHNVIKIKPPMVLTRQDIDMTLALLNDVLSAYGD